MMFDSLPTTVQQIKAGKLKGLGITSTKALAAAAGPAHRSRGRRARL